MVSVLVSCGEGWGFELYQRHTSNRDVEDGTWLFFFKLGKGNRPGTVLTTLPSGMQVGHEHHIPWWPSWHIKATFTLPRFYEASCGRAPYRESKLS